mgnify:CR=1 FL=1
MELINYNDEKTIETLRKTVAQEATREEFAMFVQFCKSTGLNPFKKEIWFIKTKGYTKRDGTVVEPKVQLMTGVNGYWAIANSHPQFDGVEQDIETDEKGYPIKAITKVYRKDRKFPSVGIALMREYGKDSTIWRQMPSVMLTKCSESIALRKAFPQELNGLYTEEEMPKEYSAEPVNITPKVEEPVSVVEEVTYYGFPDEVLTEERKRWLDKRGVKFNDVMGCYQSPCDLGERLAQYKVNPFENETEAA